MDVEIERIVARFALDVVDVDMHLRDGRRRRGSAASVAATTTGSRTITSASGRADLVLRPGDRHHAHRAVEAGHVEGDVGDAVASELDHAGKQRERRLRRQIALEVAAAVAAGVDRAGRALHAVDQHAVEVADLDGELALAEEIAGRVGRLEAGQVEDADIDRRRP